MPFIADDEDLFSNKSKITIDRYNNLRNEYNTVVKNYNGIVKIIDNPTASYYPYQNIKQSSTYIEKNYRDKKYLSFQNNSSLHYEKATSGTLSFDITSGYYQMILMSGGAGGLVLYGSKTNCCAEVSGCSGSYYKLNLYFPTNGNIRVVVGNGGNRFIKSDEGVESNTREIALVSGGDSEVYFNNVLIAKCRGGGNVRYCFSGNNKDGDIEDIGIYSSTNQLGSYIISVEEYIDNVNGTFAEKGNMSYQSWTYVNNNYLNNGVGGSAQALNNNYNSIITVTNNGKDGYFKFDSLDPSSFNYLEENIDVESTKMHTLGNENEIRRKFKNALKTIYDRLSGSVPLTEDTCCEIGEITNEETSALKYTDEVLNNYPYRLIDVKTKKHNGCKKEDDYIVTYDWNTKRKIKLSDWKNFIDNTMSFDTYQPYYYNNDIIYIKDLQTNTDIYRNINGVMEKVGSGVYYDTQRNLLFETHEGNASYTMTTNIGGIIYVTLVGAGGGAGGGSTKDRWKTAGGAGGSGGWIQGSFKIDSGTVFVSVGKGGTGGAVHGKGGDIGLSGTPSTLYLNGNLIAQAGAGGGGQGSFKKTIAYMPSGPWPYNGLRGMNIISYNGIYNIEYNVNGNGSVEPLSNYSDEDVTKNQWWDIRYGMASVFSGTNYGAGGTSYPKQTGESGIDGYVKLEFQENKRLIFNNHEYKPYNGDNKDANVILYSDYLYDLQKLNRLKEYVATKDSWFDGEGYCQRSCQINCQTSVQKS